MVQCTVCLGTNTELIKRSNIKGWPFAWECQDCKASVGCHIDTYEPFGRFANGSIRRLRRLAHMQFDLIWRTGFMSRERAKRWAADELGIIGEFHISSCNARQLKLIAQISSDYLAEKSKGDSIINIKARNDERRKRELRREAIKNGIQRKRRRQRR